LQNDALLTLDDYVRLGVLDALDEHCLRLKRGASVPLLKEVMQQDVYL
jgi:hypothetical protein